MSKWTEWRDETEDSIIDWWRGSPMVQSFIYGYVVGSVVVTVLWVVFG